jgi:hypothetical protein
VVRPSASETFRKLIAQGLVGRPLEDSPGWRLTYARVGRYINQGRSHAQAGAYQYARRLQVFWGVCPECLLTIILGVRII